MTNTAGLTEDAYNEASAAAVDLIRKKYPDLDLRSGTAVRSLVVDPSAYLDSMQRDTVNRLRTAMSLEAMSRETTVPRDDAEAVLSNFGISLGGGTKAVGLVRVNLIGTTPITIRAGVTFSTEDSFEFVVTKNTTASVDPVGDETEIISSNDGKYYFTLPVEAREVGSAGNIRQGHALSTTVVFSNYFSAEAFSDFSGGEDGESIASAIARIPSALAYRGMTNELSVRAQLSAAIADPASLRAVSCVGHRDRAQLRDKHNVLGVAVGGRVDVYARLFESPGIVTFVADGKRVSAPAGDDTTRIYEVQIPDYPGFYAVKFVGPADQPDRLGSLPYELIRSTADGATVDHDFKVSDDDNVETAWSTYQRGRILIYDSADRESQEDISQFRVDLYWTAGIQEMQRIVDDDNIRNISADYVVRSPAICLVNIQAPVRLKPGVSVTASELEKVVEAYVNSRSFVPLLTRSEIANVLIQHGVESVDLSSGGMHLGGRICGADGKWYYRDGDALDVSAVGPERAMLTDGTVVFAAEPGSIQVTIVA